MMENNVKIMDNNVIDISTEDIKDVSMLSKEEQMKLIEPFMDSIKRVEDTPYPDIINAFLKKLSEKNSIRKSFGMAVKPEAVDTDLKAVIMLGMYNIVVDIFPTKFIIRMRGYEKEVEFESSGNDEITFIKTIANAFTEEDSNDENKGTEYSSMGVMMALGIIIDKFQKTFKDAKNDWVMVNNISQIYGNCIIGKKPKNDLVFYISDLCEIVVSTNNYYSDRISQPDEIVVKLNFKRSINDKNLCVYFNNLTLEMVMGYLQTDDSVKYRGYIMNVITDPVINSTVLVRLYHLIQLLVSWKYDAADIREDVRKEFEKIIFELGI